MSEFKGQIFEKFANLKKYLFTQEGALKCNEQYIPSLQSDYAIIIFEDSKAVNASDYEPVLVQSLDLSPLRNGFSSSMDIWGLQTVNFSANNALTFTYLGMPYEYNNRFDHADYNNATYTSIIHYYYAKRFTMDGTLRLKRASDKMPAVMIVNAKTFNIIYGLYNCTFSYPTFEASPQNNSLVLYKTTVTYSSYKEFLGDNLKIDGYKNNNTLTNSDLFKLTNKNK